MGSHFGFYGCSVPVSLPEYALVMLFLCVPFQFVFFYSALFSFVFLIRFLKRERKEAVELDGGEVG